jgi:hypothetical protein
MKKYLRSYFTVILLMLFASVSWARIHTLDILVVHDGATISANDALTRAASMETYANEALENSQANIRFRVVKVVNINFANPKTDVDTLKALRQDTTVQQLRSQYGADIVTMITPTGPYCGVGYVLGGRNDTIYSGLKAYAYNVVGDRCITSFAHEIGHNLGLGHSFKQNSRGGLYEWGRGHGVDNQFVTMMAYTSAYNARRVPYFSTPLLQKCQGLACGVDRAETDGADAVGAINVSGPQIAAWYESKAPEAVVNHAPTANDDFALTQKEERVDIDVLSNDVDADGDALSLEAVGSAKHGQVVIAGDMVSYTPASGYVGQDNFEYTVTDNQGHNVSAWVTVNVGWGSHYQYFEGQWNQIPDFSTLTPKAEGIVANFSLVSRTQDQDFGYRFFAQIQIPADGEYQFSVDTNGLAAVMIDGQEAANQQTASALPLSAGLHRIEVLFVQQQEHPQLQVLWQGPGISGQIPSDVLRLAEPENSFPVAGDDSVQNPSATEVIIDVLQNDVDTDGDRLMITRFTQAEHGQVSQQDNKLRYVPENGFYGIDSFSYQISDGRGGDDYGLVTIYVGQGVSYEYFEGTWTTLPDFDSLTPLSTGIQKQLNLINRNRDDHFAFRFRAQLQIPEDGYYYFFLISDDGSRLIIDDETIADIDGIHAMRWSFKRKQLSAGSHDLELQYFEYTGRQRLYLFWRGPNIRWQRLDYRHLTPRR